MIMPGVTIGSNVIVKPGCVVSRDLRDDIIFQINTEQTYSTRPMNEVKHVQDNQFVSQWAEQLFDDFEDFCGEVKRAKVLKTGKGQWTISIGNSFMKSIFILTQEVTFNNLSPNDLLFCNGFSEEMKARLSNTNWIDLGSNEFHVKKRSNVYSLILGYLEIRKGIHLTKHRN